MECKGKTRKLFVNNNIIGIYPEWNVKNPKKLKAVLIEEDWNISRMECKAGLLVVTLSSLIDWNISRMECKVVAK